MGTVDDKAQSATTTGEVQEIGSAHVAKAVWARSIRCYVLEDGRRIVDTDDFDAFFERVPAEALDEHGLGELAAFLNGSTQK